MLTTTYKTRSQAGRAILTALSSVDADEQMAEVALGLLLHIEDEDRSWEIEATRALDTVHDLLENVEFISEDAERRARDAFEDAEAAYVDATMLES